MMNYNKIRRLLKEEKPTTATRIWSTWPFFTEMAGSTGNFDYIEFVGEYSPFSQMDLENIARAAELHEMGTMIKVDFQNRAYVAQKAVAAGFQGVLFTDHRTADQVRESVRMMKPETEADQGMFGYPNRRFIGTQPYVSQTAHIERLRETVLCFMIEKKEAMDNIEEICSVPGVDMVQFGASDYCMSQRWDKSEHIEEAKEAERHMIKAALAHGVQPRCEIRTAKAAQYYIDLGVRHFCLGDQVSTLRDFWKQAGGEMRAAAEALK